jgi:hypothetical protein
MGGEEEILGGPESAELRDMLKETEMATRPIKRKIITRPNKRNKWGMETNRE